MTQLWRGPSPNGTAGNVTLSPIADGDLPMVLEWRNHPDVARFMLGQNTITEAEHQCWFDRIRCDPNQAFFIIRYKEKPFGAIYLKAKTPLLAKGQTYEAVTGMYLAPKSRYRGTALAFVPALMLNEACFAELGFTRLEACVRLFNKKAQSFNQAIGYRIDREDSDLIWMSLTLEDHHAAYRQYHKLLGR